MIQTLTRNWWLLALCAVLDATISVTYFIMQGAAGPLSFHAWNSTIVLLGKLAMAAGACTVAAGIWRSTQGKSWLAALNGLALCALGALCNLTRYPISFRTIALLLVVMAMSIGILELKTARTFRRQRRNADEWFLGLAGAASLGFAFAFVALAFRWIKVEPGSHSDLLWLGSYFAFSAICILGLALRLHGVKEQVSLRPA